MERRPLAALEAEAFRAVGRLAVGGRRFCTAALVAPDVIVTAAHCLYHPRSGSPVPLADLRFSPGYRLGHLAPPRAIVAAVEAEGFALREAPGLEDLAADVAFLALDRPVRGIPPFAVGRAGGGPLAVVSYARDRADEPSIAAPCTPVVAAPRVIALDCGAEFGASGAPVLAGEGPARRLVAVVSAIGALPQGGAVTLAAEVAPILPEAAPLLAPERLRPRPRALEPAGDAP